MGGGGTARRIVSAAAPPTTPALISGCTSAIVARYSSLSLGVQQLAPDPTTPPRIYRASAAACGVDGARMTVVGFAR
jgi:hypothetical protein